MEDLVYIFLDFDGVLHNHGKDKLFVRVEDFSKVISKYDHVRVVISSSWRLMYDYKDLAKWYFPEIKEKIVGATISIKDGYKNREDEVLEYVNRHHISQYLIIDDEERKFNRYCKNLFLVNGDKAITKKDLENLDNLLRIM